MGALADGDEAESEGEALEGELAEGEAVDEDALSLGVAVGVGVALVEGLDVPLGEDGVDGVAELAEGLGEVDGALD